MKRIFGMLSMAAAVLWLAMPAAAQGRGQGHPGGGGAAGSMGSDHATDASGNAGIAAGMSRSSAPGDLLEQNTQLASKLSGLLPAGTDLRAAAEGFKNLGQFVSAVHVSKNLEIPFHELKCTELATTEACGTMTVPSKSSTLGQAVRTLKPSMASTDTKAAVKQARKQASTDIHSTSS
jgi:hypothetical protein